MAAAHLFSSSFTPHMYRKDARAAPRSPRACAFDPRGHPSGKLTVFSWTCERSLQTMSFSSDQRSGRAERRVTTALSGSPTIVKTGSPEAIVTSVSTSMTSTPWNATVRTFATIQFAPRKHRLSIAVCGGYASTGAPPATLSFGEHPIVFFSSASVTQCARQFGDVAPNLNSSHCFRQSAPPRVSRARDWCGADYAPVQGL